MMEKLSPEEPWYLDTDVNWYIENHSQAYYKAVELSRLLQDIINYSDADKTEYIIRKAAELGMSQRTLYRHMDKYLEAAGWALKMLRDDRGQLRLLQGPVPVTGNPRIPTPSHLYARSEAEDTQHLVRQRLCPE